MPTGDASGISVVIPLYNKVGAVARAIDSVLAQQGVPLEVIVVDDESTDGSREVVERYGDRIYLIVQKNAGPSAARNRGVQQARYSWITFLDADDAFLPGCLAGHWAAIRQRPDARLSLISFRFLGRDGTSQDHLLASRMSAVLNNEGFAALEGFRAALVINVHIGAVCLRRDLFDSIGQFDTELVSWEITDFLVRLLKRAEVTVVTDRVGLVVYETPDSQSTKTHHKAPYLARVTGKVLSELQCVPWAEQKPLLVQLKSFLYVLWDIGALEDLQRLARTGRRSFVRQGLDDRFLRNAALPMPLLKTTYRLRLVKQRILAGFV